MSLFPLPLHRHILRCRSPEGGISATLWIGEVKASCTHQIRNNMAREGEYKDSLSYAIRDCLEGLSECVDTRCVALGEGEARAAGC